MESICSWQVCAKMSAKIMMFDEQLGKRNMCGFKNFKN